MCRWCTHRFVTSLLILCCLFFAGCYGRSVAPVVNGWSGQSGSASKYRVQLGDTLYSIAWAYGVDFRDLAAANHLKSPYAIHAGQELMIARGRTYIAKPISTTTQSSKQASKWRVRRTKTLAMPAQPIGKWQMPAQGKIVKKYSTKFAGNKGIDIAGRYGEPVRAAASGRVVYSGSSLKGYGNLIIIKHNDAYLSAYAFNKKLLVREGQSVKAGQKIAEMGRNNNNQVMLHFEIRRNGKPVNPIRYLG